MKRIKTVVVVFLSLVFCFGLSACDPGIYDFVDGQNGALDQLLKDVDYKQLLNAKKCYGQLMDELDFMQQRCYENSVLAGAQAYTILMTYSMADMAVEPKSLTDEQLYVKAYLYAAIKEINLYAGNVDGIVEFYSPQKILEKTELAIVYCDYMSNSL